MQEHNNTPRKRQYESTHFQAQMKRVFAAFERKPSTMLMIEKETGIMRSNITWYVDEWRKQNKIYPIGTGYCEVSKHKAVYYTTKANFCNENPILY